MKLIWHWIKDWAHRVPPIRWFGHFCAYVAGDSCIRCDAETLAEYRRRRHAP